ncbi:MAG: ABC transporter ATP-binding protein [Clostridia bacterium]|nr:ABC transporter ATP-binding protein [Clostridia bacterium]
MPGPHQMKTAKPKNFKDTILRIFSYLWDYKFLLILACICILLSSAGGVLGTYFLRSLVNDCIIPIKDGNLRPLVKMLFKMGGVYIMGAAATYIYSRLMLYITTNTLKRIRCQLFTKLMTLPVKYFDTHTHGELMSRFTNDVDTMREMLSQSIPNFISSSFTIVSVFILMIILSPILTLLVLGMLAIMLFVVSTVSRKGVGFFRKQQEAVGAVNGFVEETVEGQKVVKVFCREDEVKEEFEKLNANYRDAAASAHTTANVLMPIMGNLSYIHYALTATAGAYFYLKGFIHDLGTIVSFLQFTRTFSQPITQISMQINSIMASLAGAERVFAVLDEDPEIDEGNVTLVNARLDGDKITETDEFTGKWAWKVPSEGGYEYVSVMGDVKLNNVTFGYEKNKTVLNDISLYAKPGQKIAFVGSTGAGKTTITNLLNRFYDIDAGTITYDGIELCDIKKDDLRRSMSMVLQDTHLFTGTVRDNIRYGRADATDEDVERAARLANAHFFISHLPEGYDTVLTGDGANLSQGQRQLLSIARAAIANAPVLILDEATSSIDTRTEALIEKGMDTLMEGRTVFVIAHRLSTVRNSNAIMVLENGKIIERGDHDDLIAQKGRYYKLYMGMFELA